MKELFLFKATDIQWKRTESNNERGKYKGAPKTTLIWQAYHIVETFTLVQVLWSDFQI